MTRTGKAEDEKPALGLVHVPLEQICQRHRTMASAGNPAFFKSWTRPKSRLHNQRRTSACVSFAIGHFLETEPYRTKVTDEFLIERYHRAQALDGMPGAEPDYFGTTLEGGFAAYRETGHVTGGMRIGSQFSAIVHWLRTRGPVVMGTPWPTGMANPDKNGKVHAGGVDMGWHAWLLDGIDYRASLQGEAFGTNSHGITYGYAGRMRMTLRTLHTLLEKGGYAISMLEQ